MGTWFVCSYSQNFNIWTSDQGTLWAVRALGMMVILSITRKATERMASSYPLLSVYVFCLVGLCAGSVGWCVSYVCVAFLAFGFLGRCWWIGVGGDRQACLELGADPSGLPGLSFLFPLAGMADWPRSRCWCRSRWG